MAQLKDTIILGDLSVTGTAYASQFIGPISNDYAEYRESDIKEAGRCIVEKGDDTLELSSRRLQKGCFIISDTYGFIQGRTRTANTPVALCGRVLAYPYENKEDFKKHIGDAVCSAPNGTVSIMTEEEVKNNPLSIVGTISSVPEYEVWGDVDYKNIVKVNNRVWINIK